MAKRILDNVRLGLLVLAGLVVLVLALYLVGQEDSLFEDTFPLKTRFENVNGLVPGNNVWFSGINVGRVESVEILNDTTIEVTLLLQTRMKDVIRKDAVTSIGTEGIIGNKVVNINPSGYAAELVAPGDLLRSRKRIDTRQAMETLEKTNQDVAIIAAELKQTLQRLNNSIQMATLLDDPSLSDHLKRSLANLSHTTGQAAGAMDEISQMVDDVSAGKGNVGALLRDSSLVLDLETSLSTLKSSAENARKLTEDLNRLSASVGRDLEHGKGPAGAVLRDSAMTADLKNTLENISAGAESFNENMEALKHNFLFRRYFRKKEKGKL